MCTLQHILGHTCMDINISLLRPLHCDQTAEIDAASLLHFKAGVFPAMRCLKFSALIESSAVVISHSAWNLQKDHKPKEGILTPEP